MPKLLRRPGRWRRRTGRLLRQMGADLGLGAESPPIWLRDNPFLGKASRAETRRFGLSLRLMMIVLVLGGLLLGGLWLNQTYGRVLGLGLRIGFGLTFPAALLVVLSFAHTLFIITARAAGTVSLGDEARRGTLPDLLLTPLRRAEMLLAMGAGPARTAFVIALAGLPLYALLGQFGAVTLTDIAAFYVLFALLSYSPPTYAFPALSGAAPTPDVPAGQFGLTRPNPRAAGRPGSFNFGLFFGGLGLMMSGQTLGLVSGGWTAHLLAALQLPTASRLSILVVFTWPYYAAQMLGGRLPFFHLTVSPLWYVLPLTVGRWVSSALGSAAALSAGDPAEMRRLPLYTRAQTTARWTARAAGLCALGVVWRAWVDSGDTATLMGSLQIGRGWDAAGLLLLLGGFSLPNVCRRALASAVSPGRRSPAQAVRRALKLSLRPLGVAGLTFLIACALGGLSPFAPPVYKMAGQIVLAGAATTVWAVGLRRALPTQWTVTPYLLLLGLPVLTLSLPFPSLWALSALSPATGWLSLFAGGPDLLARFPFWTLGTPPSFWVCVGGSLLAGLALLAATGRSADAERSVTASAEVKKAVIVRHAVRTAALMVWVTARTDNPLLIYELRSRTRSGLWFSLLSSAVLLFTASLVLAVSFPGFVSILSGLSPFHFFPGGFLSSNVSVGSDLAALLLLAQVYIVCIRGQVIGEGLIARDRQRGFWGSILLSLLTMREIFWGKVLGQTASVWVAWAMASLGSLLLYGLAAPRVGIGPALAAWLVGQVFVAALFTLGVGLGASLATFPIVQKSLRGVSTLLFVGLIGLGVYGQYQWLPFGLPGSWHLLAGRLLLGSGYALTLAVPLFVFAERRIALLRRRDIVFGDGPQ